MRGYRVDMTGAGHALVRDLRDIIGDVRRLSDGRFLRWHWRHWATPDEKTTPCRIRRDAVDCLIEADKAQLQEIHEAWSHIRERYDKLVASADSDDEEWDAGKTALEDLKETVMRRREVMWETHRRICEEEAG